jgi:plasmid stabilization system protein ParE
VKRRFLLTPEAKADLQNILSDIADDSPDTAKRLWSEIYDAFQRLGQSPAIGHFHDELLDRRYRFSNFYSYVICYLWARKPIQIIAVIHGARDLAALLSSRINID